MFKETDKKIITSTQNPLVKHLVKLRESRSYREKTQQALLSGDHLIAEVMPYLTPSKLFVLKDYVLTKLSCPNTYFVTENVLKKLTPYPEYEKAVAEFSIPKHKSLQGKHILALDAISDPGNLGTLIRTALALKWDGVFLLPGCCDLFNDKTIRSSRGGSFLFPFCYGSYEDLFAFSEKNELTFYIAHLKGEDVRHISSVENALLLLSNEGRGVIEKIKGKGKEITIPISPIMESLNVAIAGGILMYSLKGPIV